MDMRIRRPVSALLVLAFFIGALLACAGCGNGNKVTVLSFYSEGNESAEEFQATLDELKKEYEGVVVFEHIDMSDPSEKGTIEKYHVTMDPTYIILNTEGQVKQTFMGKPHEEMFTSALVGLLPSEERKSVPQPGQTSPQSPVPTTSSPASSIPNVPATPDQ